MNILVKAKEIIADKVWNIWNISYSPPSIENIGHKDVKIFVITHKDDDLPSIFDNKVYVPLRVGNKINPTKRHEWLVDDAGVNISSYNLLINEITGIWWIAKHYEEVGSPEFVGFNHYRRFLQWRPDVLRRNTLISTSGFYWRNTLKEVSRNDPLDLFRERFMQCFKGSEYVDDYDRYFNGHTIYYSNLFITDKTTFFRYFEFLERCLEFIFAMIEQGDISLSDKSPYFQRVYGFYLEHLTSYWIYHSSREVRHITARETTLEKYSSYLEA